jgi:hypothetical protein
MEEVRRRDRKKRTNKIDKLANEEFIKGELKYFNRFFKYRWMWMNMENADGWM